MTTSIPTPRQAAMRRLVRIIQDPDTGAARVFSAASDDLQSVVLVAQLIGIPLLITHVDLRTCTAWEQVVSPEEIL